MKLKKFLSIACASVMVLSLAACANNGGSKSAASVDFEDGKFGFVLMNTDVKAADASVLSIKEVNGSKVLFAENQGSKTTKIGIDLTALLGDDVAKLATIEFQLGTQAEKFAASSGKIYGFFGEKANVDLGNFSVYLDTKNPVDVSVSVSGLNAGEKNYIVINRSEDLGDVASSMFVDNIVLKDADGKVLKANTDSTFDAPEGYTVDWSKVTGESVTLNSSIPDAWALGETILPEVLENYTEKGVKITYSMMFNDACDNICFKLVAPDYTLVDTLTDASGNNVGGFGNYTNEACPDGDHSWHLKLDGVFHTTDVTATELTVELAPETVKRLIEIGGLSAQINGCAASSALLDQPAEAITVDRSNAVELPACYPGDWAGVNEGLVIPFANLKVGAQISVDIVVIDLEKYTDQWKICPFNADGWAKLTKYVTDSSVKLNDVDPENPDEVFFCPTLEDTVIKFTLTQEMYDDIKAKVDANADGWGGLGFQVNGVGVTAVSVDGEEVFKFEESAKGDDASDANSDYAGDWKNAGADVSGFKAGAKVTMDVTIVNDADHEYWLITPIDSAWGKIVDQITDANVPLNDNKDFLQLAADTTQITFTVSEDLAANIFDFQVFGVIVDKVTVE